MPTLLLDALHGAEDIEEPGRARGFGCHRRPAATNLLPTFFLLFFSTRAFFFFLSLSLFQRASVASFPLQPVEPFHRFSVSLALHGPPRPLRSPLRERDFLRVFFPSSSSSSPSSSSSSLSLLSRFCLIFVFSIDFLRQTDSGPPGRANSSVQAHLEELDVSISPSRGGNGKKIGSRFT